jgi:uncharacterized protein YlxW (UPF0749 family)
MKNPNIKLVAIVPSLDGGCQYVGLVKNITNEEYATLLKEQRTNEQKQAKEKRELLERVETLESEITTLKHEIKVLKGEDEDEESIED